MKKEFERPEFEIILFTDADIIMTSSGFGDDYDPESGDGWIYPPTNP